MSKKHQEIVRLEMSGFFFLIFVNFIEVWLIYNVVLIFAAQQSDFVIHIYIFCFIFWAVRSYRGVQSKKCMHRIQISDRITNI